MGGTGGRTDQQPGISLSVSKLLLSRRNRGDCQADSQLKGAGLGHDPNLLLTALNRQEDAMPGPETRNPDIPAPTVAPLAAFPGVAPGATAMEVLRAVPDLVKSTPAAADLPATMAELVPGTEPEVIPPESKGLRK